MRAEKTLRLARVVGAMAAENLSEVARTVEATDEFELRAPSEHSWVLMAYTYLGEFHIWRRRARHGTDTANRVLIY